jgi:uncharacterized membrane protein YqjE
MASAGQRSITTILTDIVGNVQQIVRAEIRLATLEVRQEVGKARRSASLLIIGSAIAVLALAFGLLACVYLLTTVVAPWAAALIVAAGAGIVAGTLVAVGMKRMQQVAIAPPRTMAAIEENIQWAKTSTR